MSKLAILDRKVEALQTRLAKANESLGKVTAELAAAITERDTYESTNAATAAIDSGLPNGTQVVFTYGRAETRKNLEGIVVATKPQEKGATLYRIRVGEGFDEQVLTVQAPAIVSHNYQSTPDASTDPLAGVTGEVTSA